MRWMGWYGWLGCRKWNKGGDAIRAGLCGVSSTAEGGRESFSGEVVREGKERSLISVVLVCLMDVYLIVGYAGGVRFVLCLGYMQVKMDAEV